MTVNQAIRFFYSDTRTIAPYITKCFLGSMFIAIAAQIAIPFWPVPMTMQAYAILTIGLIASPSVAAGTVSLYILEGIMGIPVFSGFLGSSFVLFGSTGGYIFGFLVAAVAMSFLKEWHQNKATKKFVVGIVGQVLICIFGISWLASFMGFDSAIKLGLYPFLVKIPFSILLAVVTAQTMSSYQNKLEFDV